MKNKSGVSDRKKRYNRKKRGYIGSEMSIEGYNVVVGNYYSVSNMIEEKGEGTV